MLYSKKELYSILSDIESKVNDNIRRNTQCNQVNENIRRNLKEFQTNDIERKDTQDKGKNKQNKKFKNIEELKEELFKDNNVKESYEKIKNELPVNTLFNFMDGTKVRLTHPYSFSNEDRNKEYNDDIITNIKKSKQKFQTKDFQSSLFKDQSNNQDYMDYENLNEKEYKPINYNSHVNKNENLNMFNNIRHRNNQKPKIDKEKENNNINLSNFKPISEINSKTENERKDPTQSEEIEKLQLKIKEFLFEVKIFLMLILFRFYNSISQSTFFVPDEYWQSIEVAHNYVYNYGYLTWEWKEKIRSFSYPLLFTLPYMILKRYNLDDTDLLVYTSLFIYILIILK